MPIMNVHKPSGGIVFIMTDEEKKNYELQKDLEKERKRVEQEKQEMMKKMKELEEKLERVNVLIDKLEEKGVGKS